MSHGKIEVNVGGVAFSGEGEQAWLAEQLEKVLKAASTISTIQVPINKISTVGNEDDNFSISLASYIKDKGGESNQVDRFLITANWLRLRGSKQLTTAEISKALKDNHQKKLTNPADCLKQNVSKGYCEKDGKSFYITPEGLKKLGD